MKISLLILLGLTLAFMVQTGEAKKEKFFQGHGKCKRGRNGILKGGESYQYSVAGEMFQCDCPWKGGDEECYSCREKKCSDRKK
jgi:hypothetical protein